MKHNRKKNNFLLSQQQDCDLFILIFLAKTYGAKLYRMQQMFVLVLLELLGLVEFVTDLNILFLRSTVDSQLFQYLYKIYCAYTEILMNFYIFNSRF